jgi:hypothetical protein
MDDRVLPIYSQISRSTTNILVFKHIKIEMNDGIPGLDFSLRLRQGAGP